MRMRVAYQFPDRSEVTYLERIPSEGSTLKLHGDALHVESVDLDTTGGYIVRLSPARALERQRHEERSGLETIRRG
jgi:hypothetical protein